MIIWAVIPVLFILSSVSYSAIVPVGAGSYTTVLPPGEPASQSAIYRTSNVTGPIPTNDWWSSIVFNQYSYQHYALPLAFDFERDSSDILNFMIRRPDNFVYHRSGTNPNIDGVMALFGGTTGMAIRVRKTDGSYLNPANVRVDDYSDWTVTVRLEDASGEYMRATYGRGFVFTYLEFSRNIAGFDIEFQNTISGFDGNGNNIIGISNPPYSEVRSDSLGITINKVNGNNYYGLYGPPGTRFLRTRQSPPALSVTLPASADMKYFSIGILTDEMDMGFYRNYAYAFVTDTTVNWSYDPRTNDVTTVFNVTTVPKRDNQTTTLMCLFPHQWKNSVNTNFLPQEYRTLKGRLRVIEGNTFSVVNKFLGILPFLPDEGSYDRNHLRSLLVAARNTPLDLSGNDTYWGGKRMGNVARVIPIADQLGDTETRNILISRLRTYLSDWFTYTPGETDSFFYYDDNWGGFTGYNTSFGSENFNDKHFHHGYFVFASAILAMYDSSFMNDYSGMVNLVLNDAANPHRNDAMTPFLRTMDPYAGHSWADGRARGDAGNNQESTSEAMNFWSGVILWGLVTGNTTYRDLGIWGYTTEYSAIREYWFDIDREIFTTYPSYTRSLVSILFGGKVDHATWFSGEVECIHGIQWIPLHAGNLYMGYDVDYARLSYNEMVAKNSGPENLPGWYDIMWRYQALFDPAAVIAKYQEIPSYLNDGETWAHLYHWIHNFNNLGALYASYYTDTQLYAVFNKAGVKSYAAYNPSPVELDVRFYRLQDRSFAGVLKVDAYSMAVSTFLLVNAPPINAPPQVNIITPHNGQILTGIVNVLAGATDDRGISGVNFYLDNVLVAVDVNPPYGYNWDTSKVRDGVYVIRAVATDTEMLTSSSTVSVTVNNTLASGVRVHPNPCNLSRGDKITFTNLPNDCWIEIYNIAGDLVYESPKVMGGTYIWECINNKGETLASGLYFYIIKGAALQEGRIAIIK